MAHAPQETPAQGASAKSDFMLPRWQVGAFTLPAVPIAALGLPLVVYLPPFYVSHLGLGTALIGNIFMIARFWDIFTDPVFGFLGDRYETRWGRRRPWILVATPILMFTVWKIFFPSEGVSGSYLLWWLVVLYVGWTMITISHMSWGAELSQKYHERSRVQGWREFALIAGTFGTLTLPAIVEIFSPENAEIARINAMGWFIILTLPIAVFVALRFVPEQRFARTRDPVDWREAMRLLARNKALRRLLLVDIFIGLAPGISASLYVFFVAHVFGLPQAVSTILLIYFLCGFVSIPFWIKLSYKIGKSKTLSVAMLYGVFTLPWLLILPRGEFWWVFGALAVYGLNFGAGAFLLRSMMADVADADELETGEQRTGMCYALLNMTNKIGYALAIGITFNLLAFIGFDASAQNAPEVLDQILYIYVFLPTFFMLIAGILIYNFPLNETRQKEIREELLEKNGTAKAEYY